MRSLMIRSGLLLVVAGLVACGADSDSGSDSQAIENRRPKVTDNVFSTLMSSAKPMQPYNSIVDSTLSGAPCVETPDGTVPQADKSGAESEVSLQQVADRETLAADIGANVTVQAGIAPGPNVRAGLNLLGHYDTSKSTLSFLLKSTKAVREGYSGDYRLTTAAQSLLRSDPKRFVKQCGRAFISGMTRRATLYALVQIHVENEEVAAAMATNLGGSASFGPIGEITANVSSSVAALRDKLGLKVTVDVVMDGFSTTLNVPTLDMSQLGKPVTTTEAGPDPGSNDPYATATLPAAPANAEATDRALATFATQLQEMLTAAQTVQQDVIDGRGASAPRLAEVAVTPYRTLATYAEDDVGFDEVDRILTDADTYLKHVLEVRRQIKNVVEFEINPFVREAQKAADGTGLVAYNLRALTSDGAVDTAKFMIDPGALLRIGKTWRDDFTGEDEETTGGLVEKLLYDCSMSAQNGDYRACDEAKFTASLDKARAKVAEYGAKARILPLVFSSSQPVTHGERQKQCVDGWHVANGKTEVAALSLVVPQNAQSGAPKFSVWVDNPPTACGATLAPLYSVDGTAGTFLCRDDGTFSKWKLPVLCVPRSGPFGLVSDVPGETAEKF